jgi:hypothetical protein
VFTLILIASNVTYFLLTSFSKIIRRPEGSTDQAYSSGNKKGLKYPDICIMAIYAAGPI